MFLKEYFFVFTSIRKLPSLIKLEFIHQSVRFVNLKLAVQCTRCDQKITIIFKYCDLKMFDFRILFTFWKNLK